MSVLSKSRTAVLLVSAAMLLSACDSLREATGSAKTSPDEFAVVTKAPLILPPEYNLRPPQPGAAPLNQTAPSIAAQNALFGADTMTVANSLPGSLSSGERLLLAHANTQNANPAIRQQLSSDARNMQGADESFTNDVLFWKSAPVDTGGKAVDAESETNRIDTAKAGGTTPGLPPGAQPQPAPPPPAQKDEGGWFDWF